MITMSAKNAGTPEIKANRAFLKEAPQYAIQQLNDYQRGVANTRAKAVKTNSALPKRSWEVLDETVYQTQDDTLTLVSDLREAGLVTTRDLMSKNDLWPLVDDEGSADIAMTPEAETDEGRVAWAQDGVPIPVIYDFFSLGFREAQSDESGRDVADDLDTIGLSTTTRRVNEKIEDLFINGWGETIQFDGDGYTLYGLTNHPQTNTGSVTADWTSDETVIRDDVRSMRGTIKNDNNYSPGGTGFWLYLGTDFYDALDEADPEGDGNQTVRERVENLAGISRVRELDKLGSKEALMFRPTEDVVDVGVAAEVQPVQWETPFRDNWAVLGAVYPRVKKTKSNQSGVLYWTT